MVFAELTNVWPATVGTSTVASYVTVVDAPWFSAKEDGYVHVISVPVQLGALVVEVATTPTGSAGAVTGVVTVRCSGTQSVRTTSCAAEPEFVDVSE